MQELFLRANYLYEHGEISQALAAYQEVSPKGSATWYNMGVCWYRQGNDAQALACWLQAEYTASFKELRMIAHAIDMVRSKRGGEQHAGLLVRFGHVVRLYVRALPLALIQLLLLLGLCLLFFCSKWWYYGKHGKGILLGASCMTLVALGNLFFLYQEQHGRRGVIVAQAPLYSGPNVQFHEQGALVCATEVAIQKTQGSWYKVAHNDSTGWVTADAIVVV